jgi:cytochrome P450
MFGMGPQVCPGKNLALMIFQLALFYVFKSWTINTKNILWNNQDLPDMMNPCKIEFVVTKN